MNFKTLISGFILLALAGCAAGSVNQSAQQEDSIYQLQKRLEHQEESLAMLKADIQEVQARVEALRNETAQRLMDLEFSLEPGAGHPGPGPHEYEYRHESPQPRDQFQTIPGQLQGPDPDAHVPVMAEIARDEARKLYDQALVRYFDEQPLLARNKLRELIQTYPESGLIPNAWYWIAETYYMERNFPRAIIAFRQVLDKFPDDLKAPDALLKIGYCYEHLEDYRNALFYLGVLIQDYPDSPAARRAGPKIEELRQKV